MILTTAQYSVLNKIARRTKMDCWFLIKQHDGQDYVYDLEDGINFPLDVGITYLMEGLDCPENLAICELNWIEKTVLRELCISLNIAVPQPLEVR